MTAPFMSMLTAFADARSRDQTRRDVWTEREVHPVGDRPIGTGWFCTQNDGIEAVWERRRVTMVPL